MDKVAILLCTYNDKYFLQKQLDSYAAQTHPHWELHVSNDGDLPETMATLKKFQEKSTHPMMIRPGPKRGFALNFLSLACDENIQADYFAFSDQDDIWENDKLTRALTWLKTISIEVPAIYCSRTTLIDMYDQVMGLSPYFKKPASFRHALVQNIACGNTMVFNQAARELLIKAGIIPIPAHDWWLYILATGCGGKVFYDTHPTVRYRQHAGNVIGFRPNVTDRVLSALKLFKGKFKANNMMISHGLNKILSNLTGENRECFIYLLEARHQSLLSRIKNVWKSGVYRQTFIGNCGLIVATLINKL